MNSAPTQFRYKASLKSERMWGVLLAAYCACLIISNVLASKVFAMGPLTLPCGVIIFPVVYIINDVMAEIFPLYQVRKGILLAFVLNALAVVCYEIAIILPGFGENVFAEVLGSSWRTLVASFVAYLVGANVNAWIMSRMHHRFGERHLFARCVISTIIGEHLDAFAFITIAFFGVMDTSTLLMMIVGQAAFKTLYEVLMYPVTRVVIERIKHELA